jgi:hypothetical protein
MTLSPHFPEWLVYVGPIVLSFLKLRVPPIWRELVTLAVTVIGTALAVLLTEITWGEAVSQGAIWFLMLAGTWQIATGTIHAVQAQKAGIPPISSAHRAVVPILFGLFLVAGVALATPDSTSVVASPLSETARQTANLWILLGMQYLAKLLDRWLKV